MQNILHNETLGYLEMAWGSFVTLFNGNTNQIHLGRYLFSGAKIASPSILPHIKKFPKIYKKVLSQNKNLSSLEETPTLIQNWLIYLGSLAYQELFTNLDELHPSIEKIIKWESLKKDSSEHTKKNIHKLLFEGYLFECLNVLFSIQKQDDDKAHIQKLMVNNVGKLFEQVSPLRLVFQELQLLMQSYVNMLNDEIKKNNLKAQRYIHKAQRKALFDAKFSILDAHLNRIKSLQLQLNSINQRNAFTVNSIIAISDSFNANLQKLEEFKVIYKPSGIFKRFINWIIQGFFKIKDHDKKIFMKSNFYKVRQKFYLKYNKFSEKIANQFLHTKNPDAKTELVSKDSVYINKLNTEVAHEASDKPRWESDSNISQQAISSRSANTSGSSDSSVLGSEDEIKLTVRNVEISAVKLICSQSSSENSGSVSDTEKDEDSSTVVLASLDDDEISEKDSKYNKDNAQVSNTISQAIIITKNLFLEDLISALLKDEKQTFLENCIRKTQNGALFSLIGAKKKKEELLAFFSLKESRNELINILEKLDKEPSDSNKLLEFLERMQKLNNFNMAQKKEITNKMHHTFANDFNNNKQDLINFINRALFRYYSDKINDHNETIINLERVRIKRLLEKFLRVELKDNSLSLVSPDEEKYALDKSSQKKKNGDGVEFFSKMWLRRARNACHSNPNTSELQKRWKPKASDSSKLIDAQNTTVVTLQS